MNKEEKVTSEERNEIAEVKEKEVAKREPVKYHTDFSLGIFGSSDNFMMATQMAKAFAGSTIVPKEYHGHFENGLVAIELATRMKISPLAVMQNLDIIQGRPSWRASFLIGMINSSGKYDMELQFLEEQDKNGKPFACTCWTEKDGRKVTGIKVDMNMVNAEGWNRKPSSKWVTMPQVMLRYRAASFFARMNCPELTSGLYTAEEVSEFTEIPAEPMKVRPNSIPFQTPPVLEERMAAPVPKKAEKQVVENVIDHSDAVEAEEDPFA